MYKTDAQLFINANNNINSAKALINECRRLINQVNLPNNSDYENCVEKISDCDIEGLVNLVETTKESLFKIDQEFANEYMNILQEHLTTMSIDTSTMTDEEKMQYSIQMDSYTRDYNYNLLYILEKYEETGQLTQEMQQQLEIQRALVEQYGIQDEMAGLLPTSSKYIDLYEKNAEYDRKLIELNSSLTDKEKIDTLAAYNEQYESQHTLLELNHDIANLQEELEGLEPGTEKYYEKENEIRQLQIDYYETKENLTDAEKQNLQFLKNGVELNELYIEKEQNNNFFHPFVESYYEEAILDKKISMGIATEDEIAYDQMNAWERAWEDTKTFTTSFVFGIGSVTENVIDGAVMLSGGIGSLFGADTQWAEDFVSVSYANDAYTGLVQSGGINEVAAYSEWRTVGNIGGTTVGYVCLSFLPGGKWTTMATGGLSAMGSSSERAFQSGADWNEALTVAGISGILGAASGYGIGGGITSGAKTWGQVFGKTVLGGSIAMVEPIVNSGSEYLIYANDMVDENGNLLYDNIFDYYVDSGGLINTIMAFGAGTVSSAFEATLRRNRIYTQSDCYNDIKVLREKGYSDAQIFDYVIDQGEKFSNYVSRRTAAESCYKYMRTMGYTDVAAGKILETLYWDRLGQRKMTTFLVDQYGIQYNVVNNFNQNDQAFTIAYIQSVLDTMPAELRSTVKVVNLYDTFNPADFCWQWKYNNTNGYFVSAATGGGGQINIWANKWVDSGIIYHEAGHCFDTNFSLSRSKQYVDAMAQDKLFNGLDAITNYGENDYCEDFADSIAAYFGQINGVDINQFPNRRAVLDQLFLGYGYNISPDTVNDLNTVFNAMYNKYGHQKAYEAFSQYIQNGNVNVFTRDYGARDIISRTNRVEVLKYYKLLNGGNI